MRWHLVLMVLGFYLMTPDAPLRAADLIEAWDPGLTDLELYCGGDSRNELGNIATILGYGAGGGFSLGLLFNHYNQDTDQAGFLAIWSSRDGNLDFWVLTAPAIEREIISSGISWEFGMEWSRDLNRAGTFYVRPSRLFDKGSGHWHPLVGIMYPLPPIELHIEISSEEPETGVWPVHIAVGPNFRLSRSIEIIPEISFIDEQLATGGRWEWSLGMIITLGQEQR